MKVQFWIWSAIGLLLYFTFSSVYTTSLTVSIATLEWAGLAHWNGGNWIAVFCSLIACCGYAACMVTLPQVVLTAKNREAIERGIASLLVTPILLVSTWIGIIGASAFLFPALSTSLTFVLATYIAILIGARGLAPIYRPSSNVIRGNPMGQGKKLALKWREKRIRGLIPWGASFIEKQNESLHFISIGNTGGGKSTWLEVFMTKTLAGIGFNPNQRAIVVDAKSDLIPFLEALGLGVGTDENERWYVILNPLDQRCHRWAVAKDVNTPGKAHEFARIIVPETQGDSRFFGQTAVSLLTAVIVSLQKAKGETWTFRDLINAFSSPKVAQALIQSWHLRPQDFEDYFKVKKGDRNDIFTTVRSELDQFQLVAALWEYAPNQFSITDWERGEYVLVLGADYEYPDTLKRINSLLFTFIAARLKQQSNDSERRIWIFADELVATGKQVGFEPLLQLGRSKGVCIVSSLLSMATFTEEFGENIAKSILELSRHKALFPMGSDSAKFISESIGKYECIDPSYSPPNSPETPLSGVTHKRAERFTVLAQELMDMNLPQPGPKNGLTGYFIAPGEGIHRHTYSWKQIQNWRPERLEGVVAYDRIDERFTNTIPAPWNESELTQLKLNLSDEPAPERTERRSPPKPSGRPFQRPKRRNPDQNSDRN